MQWFRRHNHLPSQIPQGLQVRTVDISPAQLLSIGTDPVTLIPAAGPNTQVLIVAAHVQMYGNGSGQYAQVSSDARVVYEGTVNPELFGVGTVMYWSVLGLTAKDAMYGQDGSQWETSLGESINKNVVLTTYDGVNPTGGTSHMRVTMTYMVINLA